MAGALTRRGEPGADRTPVAAARGPSAALCVGLVLGLAAPAPAAEFTVTSTANSGAGTLREAIGLANASADATNTIVFDVADASTITLTTALPDITTNDLVIDGSDVMDLVIEGFDPAQIFLRSVGVDLTLIDVLPEGGDMELADAQNLTFDTPNDLEVASDLLDPMSVTSGGALVKDGAATLTLRGANTYSGGTTILEGALRGDTTSLQGDIDIDASAAMLIFDQDDGDGVYAGVISGSGGVEKTGADQVTFTADHDYTGSTTVSQGRLLVTGTLPANGDIAVASGATLELEPAADFALDGALDGAGALITRGDTIGIELNGGGAFTGPITINGGSLVDASGVIRGNVSLVEAGTEPQLSFDVTGSQTHSGNITGTGQVIKIGAGTLTLTGDNTFTRANPLVDPAFRLEEGTLIGTSSSIRGDVETGVVEDATLVFDQSFSGTYSGEVYSNGIADLSFEKRGSGTLTITNNVEASGGATISGGILLVDGASAGTFDVPSTFVAAGAKLGGNGDVYGTTTVAGRLAPQGPGPQDALTLDEVVFQPGSIFEVNLDAMNNADYIDAPIADVGSGTLQVSLAPGDYSAGSTALILSSGALTGVFQVDSDLAFLDQSLAVMGNDLFLTVMSNSNTISSFASTPNQMTVAAVLEAEQLAGPTGDLAAVFDSIEVLGADEVAPMLDAVGGEPLTAFPTLWRETSLRFERAVQRRVRDAGWGAEKPLATLAGEDAAGARPFDAGRPRWPALPRVGSGLPLAQAYGGPRAPMGFQAFEGGSGFGTWLDAFGVIGSLDGDGNSAQLDYELYGGSLGLDYAFGDRLVAGLAAGYAHADADLDKRASDGEVDTLQGALYAGYVAPRFYASGSGHYAHAWNDSRRYIGFGIDRTASADFTSQTVGARGELGAHGLRLFGVDITPSAGFDWARLSHDAFDERGAGALDLEVDGETLTSLVSSLGGTLSGVILMDQGLRMQPVLRAYWLHEFGDRDRILSARLNGAVASSRFEIAGAEVPRDWILAGLGWSISVGDALRVFASYDVGISDTLLQHELTLAARFQF